MRNCFISKNLENTFLQFTFLRRPFTLKPYVTGESSLNHVNLIPKKHTAIRILQKKNIPFIKYTKKSFKLVSVKLDCKIWL